MSTPDKIRPNIQAPAWHFLVLLYPPVPGAPCYCPSPAGRVRLICLIAGVSGLPAIWLSIRLRELHKVDDPGEGCQAPKHALQPSLEATIQAGPLGFSPACWLTLGLPMLFAFANSSNTQLLLCARNWARTTSRSSWTICPSTPPTPCPRYPLGILIDRIGRWRVLIAG